MRPFIESCTCTTGFIAPLAVPCCLNTRSIVLYRARACKGLVAYALLLKLIKVQNTKCHIAIIPRDKFLLVIAGHIGPVSDGCHKLPIVAGAAQRPQVLRMARLYM